MSITIKSPDGKYTIEQSDDFGEIGMGSPEFGHITLHGATGHIPDRLFGRTVLFSPDSRFVAVEELFEAKPFRTKLLVIELPRCKMFTVQLPPQGTATPLRWDTPAKLIYTIWSIGSAPTLCDWDAP